MTSEEIKATEVRPGDVIWAVRSHAWLTVVRIERIGGLIVCCGADDNEVTLVSNDDILRQVKNETMDIHTWFGLTYSNYLVLPRSVLQSMPDEWQHEFTALLDKAHEAFGHLAWPDYEVKTLKRARNYVGDYDDCSECYGEKPDCEICDGDGRLDRDEPYETAEEVGYRTDPIPHYNRGRTRLEPSNA